MKGTIKLDISGQNQKEIIVNLDKVNKQQEEYNFIPD